MKCRGASQTPRGADGADHGDNGEQTGISTFKQAEGREGRRRAGANNYRRREVPLQS